MKRNKKLLIKAMLKTPINQKARLIKEAQRLDNEGADIIRVAIEKPSSLSVIKLLKEKVNARIEADVHFDPRLTIGSIEQGADIVRFNPRNITDTKKVKEFLAFAKKHGTYIRIGVNSGGFQGKYTDSSLAKAMVSEMTKWVKFCEKENFKRLYLSFKAQKVSTTVKANKIFYAKCSDYPMHLGVTATGPYEDGVVKSSLALGALLSEGIGDALRLSLNAPSWEEVRVAKMIVQFMGFESFGPEIISCPTCSRTCIDLRKRVEDFKKIVQSDDKLKKSNLEIALMGCVVNGPGEASQADLGIAFAKKDGSAVLFKKGKIVEKIREDQYKEKLLKHIKDIL